jgi:hypothetical protein
MEETVRHNRMIEQLEQKKLDAMSWHGKNDERVGLEGEVGIGVQQAS